MRIIYYEALVMNFGRGRTHECVYIGDRKKVRCCFYCWEHDRKKTEIVEFANFCPACRRKIYWHREMRDIEDVEAAEKLRLIYTPLTTDPRYRKKVREWDKKFYKLLR